MQNEPFNQVKALIQGYTVTFTYRMNDVNTALIYRGELLCGIAAASDLDSVSILQKVHNVIDSFNDKTYTVDGFELKLSEIMDLNSSENDYQMINAIKRMAVNETFHFGMNTEVKRIS